MKPNFFCIGVPKTATTTLYSVLVNGGYIFNSRLKEPHYLTYKGKREFVLSDGKQMGIMDTWAGSQQEYLELFTGAPKGLLTADFSTHYLHEVEKFTQNGVKLFGWDFTSTPILVILRHPVDRAFSHFAMKVRDGKEQLSFSKAIDAEVIKERLDSGYLPSYDYIGFSRYEKSIKYLQENFENVLILDHKDIKNNFDSTLNSLGRFLNIEIKNNSIPPVLNKSGRPKSGFISSTINKYVYQDNWLKKLIPAGVKNKIALKLKAKVYNLSMDPIKITPEEYNKAERLLAKEILFYEKFFQ